MAHQREHYLHATARQQPRLKEGLGLGSDPDPNPNPNPYPNPNPHPITLTRTNANLNPNPNPNPKPKPKPITLALALALALTLTSSPAWKTSAFEYRFLLNFTPAPFWRFSSSSRLSCFGLGSGLGWGVRSGLGSESRLSEARVRVSDES